MFCLRVVLLSLLVCFALGSSGHKSKRSAWFHRPFYTSYSDHYHSHSYGYGHTHYKYKPTCNTKNPCFKYMLVFSFDGVFDPQKDATQFRNHYWRAGFNQAAMIKEGKRAATFFKEKYGVDVTQLADEVYLAPNVTLDNGVTFSFGILPPSSNALKLVMASKKDRAQFYNAPGSVSVWHMYFSKDVVSTGSFKGTIPKDGRVVFGSVIFDTCPYESPYNPCRSFLSDNPKGRSFFRINTPSFLIDVGLITSVDFMFENDRLGKGSERGIMMRDPKTGVTRSGAIVTFPENCSDEKQCYAADRFKKKPRNFNDYW